MSNSPYQLIRSSRKTIAIIVERDGSLKVRAPMQMTEAHIRAFVESHADWITKNQARIRAILPSSPKRYTEGERFLFLGQLFPLTIVTHQRVPMTFNGTVFLLASSALPCADEVFVHWYKEQASRLLLERVLIQAERHAFHYKKIRISSARTRWGSCSSLGTLSFTYRLIMAPLKVVDYVVLHELVHTQIRNHSKTFWKRLEKLMPDYKKHQVWLKKNGKFLM